MKLTNRVYLVGSGNFGFNMTHNLDCHVFLLNGGNEFALIDAGIGLGTDSILENVKAEGFNMMKIKYLLLTHAHADHAGGAADIKNRVDCDVAISKHSADFLRRADEDAINLTFGKEAGFYPKDYSLKACEVDREISDGDKIKVGDCELQVIDTPGHCRGHVAFLMNADERSYLFVGDCVFWGGRILLQNIYDCNLQDYMASVKKLSRLSIDVFLPGHLSFSLSNGQRHINEAANAVEKLGVPPNLI